MFEDIDIWRTACLMVQRYGRRADVESWERVEDLLEAGDNEGADAWKQIIHAIDELQRQERGAGETLN